MTPLQCLSISSLRGILISSSTVIGLLTCPLMQNNLVPWLPFLPKLLNHDAPLHDSGDYRYRLYISHCSWAPIEASTSWKWRLESWSTGFSFERFNEACFLATYVSSCSTMDIDIEVIATTTGVFTKETFCVSFMNSLF